MVSATPITASVSAMAHDEFLKGFRPPAVFHDTRGFGDQVDCENEQRALDLEVQRVMENTSEGQLTSLLAR